MSQLGSIGVFIKLVRSGFKQWKRVIEWIMGPIQTGLLLLLFIFVICPIGFLLRAFGPRAKSGYLEPDEGSGDFSKLF